MMRSYALLLSQFQTRLCYIVCFTFPETQYHSKASQHSINSTKVDIHIEDTFNSDKGAFGPSAKEDSLLQDTRVNIVKDTAKGSASKNYRFFEIFYFSVSFF